MNYSLIAVRYAKALYSLSVDKQIAHTIYDDLIILDNIIINSSDLTGFLNNPIYSPSQKKEFIERAFSKRLKEITLNFIFLIIDQKREMMISDIIRNYKDLYKAGKNIKSATFQIATQVSQDFQNEIRKLLEKNYNSEIELSIEIKPELLGGFILLIDGKMMDASISHQIQQIKKKLVG